MSNGANLIDMSVENGYGRPSDKPMSNGQASYPNAPNQTPINLSGMDNFSDNSRFTGEGGPPADTQASAPGHKDSIKYAKGGM